MRVLFLALVLQGGSNRSARGELRAEHSPLRGRGLQPDVGQISAGCPLGTAFMSIDFDTLPNGDKVVSGTYVESQWLPVTITAVRRTKSMTLEPENWARLFDSSNPTGGDSDLGSPNRMCPQCTGAIPCPGVSKNDKVAVLSNCKEQGNVLIIHEGGVDDAPDDNARGGVFTFTFEAPVSRVLSIQLMDIEDKQRKPRCSVSLLDGNSQVLMRREVIGLGDNTVQDVEFDFMSESTAIKHVSVDVHTSAAVSKFSFCASTMLSPPSPEPPCPGAGDCIVADFAAASIENPIVYNDVVQTTDADVAILPPEGASVYATPINGQIGAVSSLSCPPNLVGSELLSSSTSAENFILVPLEGRDVVVYVCSGDDVIGRCVHVLASNVNYSLDFFGASIGNFISFSFSIQFQSLVSVNGCTGCDGYLLFDSSGSGVGGSGGIGGIVGGGVGIAGSPCPPQGSQLVESDNGLLLFTIEEDSIFYMCRNSMLVGYCTFVFDTVQPSRAPAEPTPFPTVSDATENQIITCIAVIDESTGSQSASGLASKWAMFRQSYPLRPFCLLQPSGQPQSALFIPMAFLVDGKATYVEVNRDQGVEDEASDWFNVCGLGSLKSEGVDKVAIFIDNSGSLTTSQVQASYGSFLQRLDAEGVALVAGIENTREDWVTPFQTDF